MSRSEPSAVGAALRLALRRLRPREEGSGSAPVPRRRPAAERRGIEVEPRRAEAYLAATQGSGIPALNGGRAALLSPTYPSLWETALAVELLAQRELPFPSGGMIHLSSEVVHLRPLELADAVRCRVEVDHVEEEPRGVRVQLVGRNWNGAGQLCVQDTLELLIRCGREGGGSGRRERGEAEAPQDPATGWTEVARWALRGSHGRRYARVSGDYNPIHLWAWSSRPFGFRRPILHGHCTAAMVAHALIEHRLGGDPAALRRLQITFRAPLELPQPVRLLVAPGAEGSARFRVVGEEEGRKPFAEGSWVG